MTMTTDFNSHRQKFMEATSKLKLIPAGDPHRNEWVIRQGTASDGMHRIAGVLASRPEIEDLDTERKRTGQAEESILAKWKNRTHPVVTEYERLVKSHDEYLKELDKVVWS